MRDTEVQSGHLRDFATTAVRIATLIGSTLQDLIILVRAVLKWLPSKLDLEDAIALVEGGVSDRYKLHNTVQALQKKHGLDRYDSAFEYQQALRQWKDTNSKKHTENAGSWTSSETKNQNGWNMCLTNLKVNVFATVLAVLLLFSQYTRVLVKKKNSRRPPVSTFKPTRPLES